MRFILAITLFIATQFSWSMTPFHQHLHSTAQSLSAFYMYELTEGDERYLTEFNKHHQDAQRALNNATDEQKSVFLSRWDKLTPFWKFEDIKNVGLNIDLRVRLDLREYMTDAYLYSKKLPSNPNAIASKLRDIKVLTSIMSARTMDVASSHLGSQSLTKHDHQIQSKDLASIVQTNIADLKKMKLARAQISALKKVKTQFDFVESSLVNHNQVVPFFLVYRNIMRLGKLLDESSQQVAGY
jgi:hypothetical protein